ncbi:hypothetical protein [Fluviicola chungangensis]|uniref:Uncharacterized protein n=1 Tax=Fluviicola chungangensis TaxID=2597671 RepID=A0A556MYI4_9FLAO|nr:hypothetical protein [Fluviicola chungangensis]TSJ44888.1 hypothetical protein FO442_09835 [Fluviicola chungangensis]
MEHSNDTRTNERVWNNLFISIYYCLCFSIIPVGLIVAFINNPRLIYALPVGLVLFWLLYELFMLAYIRITFQDGVLIFERPLGKYGLLFRKRTRRMTILPDDWSEVYSHSYKGGYSFYFRKDRTAAYFVSFDGMGSFKKELRAYFPGRKKETLDFPRHLKRKMRREMPERVF